MTHTEQTAKWARGVEARAAEAYAAALADDRPGKTEGQRAEARREAERALTRARRAARIATQREARLEAEQNPGFSFLMY